MQTERMTGPIITMRDAVEDLNRIVTAAKALTDNLVQGGAVLALPPAHAETTLETLLTQARVRAEEALNDLREMRGGGPK